MNIIRGVNPVRVGGRDPPDFAQEGRGRGRRGVVGRSWGSWKDREILFYLIMYWKYVRKGYF